MTGQLVQVGVVGAGNMGGAMVERLREQGWSAAVCDVDPERQQQAVRAGAALKASPRDVALALQPDGLLIVCVVDAVQSSEVLFGEEGAAQSMAPGQAVMLCPTLAPEAVEQLASRLHALGIGCLDAPMSGGPARAREGTMSLMLAGPAELQARFQPLLDALSSRVFRVGERIGDAARTKLVNNLLAGINLVGAAEALALAQRLGLDPSFTLDVIEQSSGQSWIGSDRMRRAVAGDLAPRAHVTLLEKDTRLAMQMARAAGFEGPLGSRAAEVFEQAHLAGLEHFDDAVLYEWLKRQPPGGHA